MYEITPEQKTRHEQLCKRLQDLKIDPYFIIPNGYWMGQNPVEDEKYERVRKAWEETIGELDELDRIVQNQNSID